MHRLGRAACVALVLAATPAAARDVAGVPVPDTVEVAGRPLQLNGAGLRTRFFLRVYVIGLYLPRPAKTLDEVVAEDGPKRIDLHFLRALDGKQIAGAIAEGFERNSADAMPALRERLGRLTAMFPAVAAGDLVTLAIDGDRTTVTVKGADRGVIDGDDFARALLAVWLGPQPADTSLRQALLGG